MSDLAFKHFAGAQTSFKPPLIANDNAFLGDVASSEQLDPVAPISSGFYRLEKGTPLVYEYTYHEMKIIVDGEFDIEDQTGQKVHAVKGDVFYFPKGSKITFTTDTFGLGFFVGQRKVFRPHCHARMWSANMIFRREVHRYNQGLEKETYLRAMFGKSATRFCPSILRDIIITISVVQLSSIVSSKPLFNCVQLL